MEVDFHCFVSFKRKPPPHVDFGVERHTLVSGRITQVLHRYSITVHQFQSARVHFSRVRA
jgi:hypothetical protein